MAVWCVVLECPQCGKQRPYPVPKRVRSVEDLEKSPILRLRLATGFGEHYVYCGGGAPPDEVVEEVIRRAKLMQVPEHVVAEVERRDKKAKWDHYGLCAC